MATLGAARVLLPDGTLGPAVIELEDERVAAVHRQPASASLPDRILAPGFVDLQVNGHQEVDVASADGDQWDRLDAFLVAQGVTSWCPTLISGPLADYAAPLGRIAARATGVAGPAGRPSIVGVHLEGPFLGGALGAHRPDAIAAIDQGWLAALPPIVRLVTLAPEVPNALAAVRQLADRGVVVSLGHSTASYEQAEDAVDAGARLVTHLFNGMGPLHHRQPGLVGAALTDDRLTVTLIADGFHVSPPLLRLAFRSKGPRRVALITDAVAWAAVGAGAPRLQLIDGVPRLSDGTIAGTALTMDRAVRVVVAAGVDPATALEAASRVPADLLGLADRGRLTPGARADVIALDGDLRPVEVWIGGDPVWPA
ncbi:MAG TPA: amidohydrolase family protein [Acidimicrobiales bacterium]|nr:amidohydrolase family protein [Acidimicrobiales bacterium]